MAVVGKSPDLSRVYGDRRLVIINPAERNAIVGFKPTVGLTSRAG
jgi:hypothetical protein